MTHGRVTCALAALLLASCSNGTEPSWSYAGEWVGEGIPVGAEATKVQLQLLTADAAAVTGSVLVGSGPAGSPPPCGSAFQGAAITQGQVYADSLVFSVPCAVGAGCTTIRFRAMRSGVGLSLSIEGVGELPLTRC